MNAPQPNLYRTPSKPGFMGSYNWVASTLGLIVLVLFSSLATQYIASRFQYQPALGSPLLRRPTYAVYEPFYWAIWGWLYCTSKDPRIRQPLFEGEMIVFGGSILSVAFFFVAAGRRARRLSKNAEDLHGSARWATEEDIRINLSPSLPIGLYQVSSGPDATLVEFCPPEPFGSMANARGYRQPGNCPDGGTPLMKPVVARAGDVVSVSKRGVAVNGKGLLNSVPLTRDTASRPLTPWPYGTYTVQPATVWVVSDYQPRSFDSRYFGPISASLIRNRLRYLLVLR